MSKLCKFPVCLSSGIQTGFCGSICLCSGVMPTPFVPHFGSIFLCGPASSSSLLNFGLVDCFVTILKTNQAGNRTNSTSLICLQTVWFLLLFLLSQLVVLIALFPPPASSSSSSSLCPCLDFLQARRDYPYPWGHGNIISPPPPPCIYACMRLLHWINLEESYD